MLGKFLDNIQFQIKIELRNVEGFFTLSIRCKNTKILNVRVATDIPEDDFGM
jgi:hypothetical protein